MNSVELAMGVTRIFGTHDLGRVGLQSGWAEPEDGHNWNDGTESVLLFTAPSLRRMCRLRVEGHAFLPRGCQNQRVFLHVNGFRLGYWNLATTGRGGPGGRCGTGTPVPEAWTYLRQMCLVPPG